MERLGKIMHSYSIDKKRINIFKIIGTTSLIFSSLLLKLVNGILDIINSLPYINYFPLISQLSMFGLFFCILYILFEKCLWKFEIFGFRMSKIPDLNGTWAGKIISNHGGRHEIDVTVTIEQTWSKMSIILKTANSKSKSKSASMFIKEKRLCYHYLNEPSSITPDTMSKHYGVAYLDFDEDGTLEGNYFNDWERGTFGKITLEKLE